jgi:cytochrome c oxidase subunit I+III
MGLAVLLFLVDLALHFRPFRGKGGAGDVWKAGTLEWIENSTYGVRSIPPVDARDPLWTHPELAELTEAGAFYLPGSVTGTRETLVTSPLHGRPDYVVRLTGPSFAPLLAALATALGFFCLTLKLVLPALALGALAVAAILAWLWETDPETQPPADVGGGCRVPVGLSGPRSHSWWGTAIVAVVSAMLFAAFVFSYLHLWTASPELWPAATGLPLPRAGWPLGAAAALLGSSAAIVAAGRSLARSRPGRRAAERMALALAPVLLVAALALEVHGQRASGLDPVQSSYGALVYTAACLQGLLTAALVVMGLYTLARSLAGRLGPERRATFDNTRLLWHWAVLHGLLALALVHLAPRVLG